MLRTNPLRQSIADTVIAVGRAFFALHRREPIGRWLEQFPAERRHVPYARIASIGRHCAAPANA